MMEQDNLEDQMFHQSLTTHLELLSRLLKTHPSINVLLKSQYFAMALTTSIILIIFLSKKFYNQQRCSNGESDDEFSASNSVSWTSSDGSVVVGALKGLRPKMEDRFISLVIENPFKQTPIKLNAVLDGHGGEVKREGHEMNWVTVSRISGRVSLNK